MMIMKVESVSSYKSVKNGWPTDESVKIMFILLSRWLLLILKQNLLNKIPKIKKEKHDENEI